MVLSTRNEPLVPTGGGFDLVGAIFSAAVTVRAGTSSTDRTHARMGDMAGLKVRVRIGGRPLTAARSPSSGRRRCCKHGPEHAVRGPDGPRAHTSPTPGPWRPPARHPSSPPM